MSVDFLGMNEWNERMDRSEEVFMAYIKSFLNLSNDNLIFIEDHSSF